MKLVMTLGARLHNFLLVFNMIYKSLYLNCAVTEKDITS